MSTTVKVSGFSGPEVALAKVFFRPPPEGFWACLREFFVIDVPDYWGLLKHKENQALIEDSEKALRAWPDKVRDEAAKGIVREIATSLQDFVARQIAPYVNGLNALDGKVEHDLGCKLRDLDAQKINGAQPMNQEAAQRESANLLLMQGAPFKGRNMSAEVKIIAKIVLAVGKRLEELVGTDAISVNIDGLGAFKDKLKRLIDNFGKNQKPVLHELREVLAHISTTSDRSA